MRMFLTNAAERSRIALRGIIAVLTVTFIGLASMAAAESYQVNAIRVDGNQRIETGTIQTYADLTLGTEHSAGEINDAVQRVRNTGLFESVDAAMSGSTLVITVVEYPTINRISFEGNSKLKDDGLAAMIGSQQRHAYSPAQAERDVATITAAYTDEGRVNATVNARIIRRSDNRVDLVFEIVEGGVTEIERISFVGNHEFSDRRLRLVLGTKQAGLLRAIIGRDTYVADRLEFDKQVLTDFYRSRGYIDFNIENVDVVLTRTRDAYLVTFNIHEGQKYSFNNVTVTSEFPEIDPADYARALRTSKGDTYSPTLIDTDINRLETKATEDGVSFVRADPRITRNDRDLTVDIEYALVHGPKIFVERIDIEGNTTTLDRVVRNQFVVAEGDPFNPRLIRQSAERIRALGFFTTSDVSAGPGSSESQVVVNVNVQEQPTGSFSFGANYSSDVGVSLVASFNEINFLGRGQKLAFNLSTAETNKTFAFDFTEPAFMDRNLSVGLSMAYRTTNNESADYDTTEVKFTPSMGFPLGERSNVLLSLGYQASEVANVTSTSAFIVADGLMGMVGTPTVGYNYSFDNRRSGLNPSAGVVLRFGQEFGVGDTTYVKTSASIGAETRFANDQITLRGSLEGGYLAYVSGASRVSDRYFMGSSVMRGFQPKGIGPRDQVTDDALGGNAYAVARLEAEFPLGLPTEFGMTGGAFVDIGSLWDTGLAGPGIIYDSFIPRSIAGVSLFWTTPIGPLRFNWTVPLDVQDFDRTRNFELTIQTRF